MFENYKVGEQVRFIEIPNTMPIGQFEAYSGEEGKY